MKSLYRLFPQSEIIATEPPEDFSGLNDEPDPEWTDQTVEIEEGDDIVAPIPRKFHFRSDEGEDTIMRTVTVGEEIHNNRVTDRIDASIGDRETFDTSQLVGTYRLEKGGSKAKREDGTVIELK